MMGGEKVTHTVPLAGVYLREVDHSLTVSADVQTNSDSEGSFSRET